MSAEDKDMKDKNDAMMREFARSGVGSGFSLLPTVKPQVKQRRSNQTDYTSDDEGEDEENAPNQADMPNSYSSTEQPRNTAPQVSPVPVQWENLVQVQEPPTRPPITPLRSVTEATQKYSAGTRLSAPFEGNTFENLCSKICDSADIKNKICEFDQKSPNEVTIKKHPNGDEVKIENNADTAICTFTGPKGMKESTKVILDGFIASGQTALNIGGADPAMVLILAQLVADKLEGPPKLTVTITSDAEKVLAAHDPQLKQILEAAKPEISRPALR